MRGHFSPFEVATPSIIMTEERLCGTQVGTATFLNKKCIISTVDDTVNSK